MEPWRPRRGSFVNRSGVAAALADGLSSVVILRVKYPPWSRVHWDKVSWQAPWIFNDSSLDRLDRGVGASWPQDAHRFHAGFIKPSHRSGTVAP
jgi:hypothetical protein